VNSAFEPKFCCFEDGDYLRIKGLYCDFEDPVFLANGESHIRAFPFGAAH